MLKTKRKLHVNVAISQSASKQRIRRSLSHQTRDQTSGTRDLTCNFSSLAKFPRLQHLIASFSGIHIDAIWIPAQSISCRGYLSDDSEGSGSNPSVAFRSWAMMKFVNGDAVPDLQQCTCCNSYYSPSSFSSDSESESSQCSFDECTELQRTDACPECVRDWWSD